jgi:hypothetical protein
MSFEFPSTCLSLAARLVKDETLEEIHSVGRPPSSEVCAEVKKFTSAESG